MLQWVNKGEEVEGAGQDFILGRSQHLLQEF
jgi:hypothetical protein